jgi:hypothetical protein
MGFGGHSLDDLWLGPQENRMTQRPTTLVAPMMVLLAVVSGFCENLRAQPTHKCDPVDPLADVGWSVVPSLETVGAVDGAPFQAGRTGDWFVERVTTRIPFCNYYNEIGIYSMRSYTLAPEVTKERVRICEHSPTGGSDPVLPYARSCPPT